MNKLSFSYKDSLLSENEINELAQRIHIEIENMNNAVKMHYEDDRTSINLPYDQETVVKVKSLIDKKKSLHPKYLIVIGIGGSNLGTMAVQEAILGRLYNQLNPEIKILYADTVDSDLIDNIIAIIKPVLEKGENILINGIIQEQLK